MTNEEKAKKITDRIFESGFNTNRTYYDMAKNVAMDMAAWKDDYYKKLLDLLVKSGADVNIINNYIKNYIE